MGGTRGVLKPSGIVVGVGRVDAAADSSHDGVERLHVELRPTGKVANWRTERVGWRTDRRVAKVLSDATAAEAAQQAASVGFATELDMRQQYHVAVERDGMTLLHRAGVRRHPG